MKPHQFSSMSRRVALTALLGLAFIGCAVCVAPAGAALAASPSQSAENLRGGDRVWIGPNPFQESRRPGEARVPGKLHPLRTDWLPILTTADKWSTVLAKTQVLKLYINILGEEGSTGVPKLSDAELRQLIQFVQGHHLKIAFEIGGLRTSAKICGDMAGETEAANELALLKRWLGLGGNIDYLTTDHAVMKNLRGVGYSGAGQNPDRACKMTFRQLVDELADYFQVVHKAIPNAKLGVIESLGFFQIRGSDGMLYKQTDPRLPEWRFTDYVDDVVQAMKARGLELDHFHIDFGYNGASFDGRASRSLNFGRILAVEAYVASKGIKSGVIFNASYDKRVKNPVPEVANREASEETLRFFNGYVASGGKADNLVIQTWQPYPDRTGPESEPFTVLSVARDILQARQPATAR
jgi:hypothetical protein